MKEAIELLKELREKLVFDINEDGEPNSSLIELTDVWGRVNDLLERFENE